MIVKESCQALEHVKHTRTKFQETRAINDFTFEFDIKVVTGQCHFKAFRARILAWLLEHFVSASTLLDF